MLDALRAAMVPIEDVDTGSLRGDLEHYLRELVNRFHSGKMRDVLPHLIGVACHDANLRCSLDDYMQTRRVPLQSDPARGADRGELSADTDLDVLIDVLLGPFAYRKLLARSVDRRRLRRQAAGARPAERLTPHEPGQCHGNDGMVVISVTKLDPSSRRAVANRARIRSFLRTYGHG